MSSSLYSNKVPHTFVGVWTLSSAYFPGKKRTYERYGSKWVSESLVRSSYVTAEANWLFETLWLVQNTERYEKSRTQADFQSKLHKPQTLWKWNEISAPVL